MLFAPRSFGRFLLKTALLLLPCLPLLAVYVVNDPFMVLRDYDRYDRSPVLLPEAHVGWQTFLHHRDSVRYDAFLLGNSCTMAFRAADWEERLGNGHRALRFFDNAESIGGVERKLRDLLAAGAQPRHVLVVIDETALKRAEPLTKTKNLYSASSAGLSDFAFQLRFVQEFFSPNFLLPYLRYLLTGKSARNVIHVGDPLRSVVSNDCLNPNEAEIARRGAAYWQEHPQLQCHDGRGESSPRRIFEPQERVLRSLRRLCAACGARLEVVVGPSWHQRTLAAADRRTLQRLFGRHFHDYSGVNALSSCRENFYDADHYRPCCGATLLREIYVDNGR